jgi:hypothetical protein
MIWKCRVNFSLGLLGWFVMREMEPFRQEIDRLVKRFFGGDSLEVAAPMWPRAESRIEDGELNA